MGALGWVGSGGHKRAQCGAGGLVGPNQGQELSGQQLAYLLVFPGLRVAQCRPDVSDAVGRQGVQLPQRLADLRTEAAHLQRAGITRRADTADLDARVVAQEAAELRAEDVLPAAAGDVPAVSFEPPQ